MATDFVTHVDTTLETEDDFDFGQSVVAGTKAVIDTTWSVLSFVLGAEAEWPGFDSDPV